MAELITYKGLKIVSPTPTGEGGQALNENFTDIADELDTLGEQVDGKAEAEHTHEISEVTGLHEELDDLGEMVSDLDGAVETLSETVDEKAPIVHTHSTSDVTGLDAALSGKAATTHTHAISDITSLQGALNSKATAYGTATHVSETRSFSTGTPGLVDNVKRLGSFTFTNEAAFVNLVLISGGGANSIHARQFSLPVSYNMTPENTWMEMLPQYDFSNNNGHGDGIKLDIRVNGYTAEFRIRKTSSIYVELVTVDIARYGNGTGGWTTNTTSELDSNPTIDPYKDDVFHSFKIVAGEIGGDKLTTGYSYNYLGDGETPVVFNSNWNQTEFGYGDDVVINRNGTWGDSTQNLLALRVGGSDVWRVKASGVVNYVPISEPDAPDEGDVYYDVDTHKLRCFDGTDWNDLF